VVAQHPLRLPRLRLRLRHLQWRKLPKVRRVVDELPIQLRVLNRVPQVSLLQAV